MAEQTTQPVELREIPLGRIIVAEGFNPRGSVVEDDALDELAQTIAQRGLLQPLRVRATDTGDYMLIAGERRYRAAQRAGLQTVPAIVRHAGDGDADEKAQLLEDALLENDQRADLDLVARAHAYQRLRDAGKTIKGIAQALGAGDDPKAQRNLERRVRETLRVLALPDDVQGLVARGVVPQSAIKALVELARLHEGLPAVAVRRVTDGPAHQWDEPVTWEQLADDPIAVIVSGYDEQDEDLPAGVFDAHANHPIARFGLDEATRADLEALCKLLAVTPDEFAVRFDREQLEQAQALKAAQASKHGYSALIVGQDVADQLAGDYIRAGLAVQRQRAEQESKWRERIGEQRAGEGAGEGQHPGEAPVDEEAAKEARRREREAEQEARRQAAAYNAELGAAVLRKLAKVRVDERVLRILTAVDLHGGLGQIAARGAGYCFPGWAQETQTKTGKTKVEYPSATDAGARAREFLAGAKTTGDIAGRAIALLVCAHYAQEECVARSAQVAYTLRPGGYAYGPARGLPWTGEVLAELEAIAQERLPEHLTAHVREAREQAQREQTERQEARQRAEQADQQLRGCLQAMSATERLEALQAFGQEHGRHSEVAWRLREYIAQLNAADEQAQAQEPAA